MTEDNQRQLFEAGMKIGICKLYTNYGVGNRGKLKPNGVLSFIRNQDLTKEEFASLSK